MSGDDVRAVLGSLAGDRERTVEGGSRATETDYAETIERATAALEDLAAAAQFIQDGGLERLERAVARADADLSDCARTGRETLCTYRALQARARGEDPDHEVPGRETR